MKDCPSCGAEGAYGCCDHCNQLDEEKDYWNRHEALQQKIESDRPTLEECMED